MEFGLGSIQETTRNPEKLSWHERAGYASGDYALNLFWQGTSYFLLFYYTNIIGLPNTVAGTIIMIGGIWDAISDPAMGYVAERTRSRWGAYRPYLLLGAVPLALSFALLFWVPAGLEGDGLYAFVLITLLIFRSCYTIVSIPYSTLGARMTSDTHERTRLMGVRMMAGFLGGMTVTGLAALFRGPLGDEAAFRILGVSCAIISVFALYYCFKATESAARRPNNAPRASGILEVVTTLARNKAFLLILLAISCVAIGNVFINATVLYYFEDVIGDRDAGNLALFIMTGTPLITIPIWSFVALKLDKKPSWILGGVVIILGSAGLYFDRSGSLVSAFLIYIFLNFGLSAYAVLFWSMLPDTIEYGEHVTGVRNESTIIGVVSSGQKTSLAISFYVLTLLLDAIGYQPGGAQNAATLEGLRLVIAGVSGSALALSAILIAFYPINALRHREILAELDARHS